MAVGFSPKAGRGETLAQPAQQRASAHWEVTSMPAKPGDPTREPRERTAARGGTAGGGKMHSAATPRPYLSLSSRRHHYRIQVPAGADLSQPQSTQVTPCYTANGTAPNADVVSQPPSDGSAAHRRAACRCNAVSAMQRRGWCSVVRGAAPTAAPAERLDAHQNGRDRHGRGPCLPDVLTTPLRGGERPQYQCAPPHQPGARHWSAPPSPRKSFRQHDC